MPVSITPEAALSDFAEEWTFSLPPTWTSSTGSSAQRRRGAGSGTPRSSVVQPHLAVRNGNWEIEFFESAGIPRRATGDPRERVRLRPRQVRETARCRDPAAVASAHQRDDAPGLPRDHQCRRRSRPAATSPRCLRRTASSSPATTCPSCARWNADEADVATRVCRQAVDALLALLKPTVAAITGYALEAGRPGAGCGLADQRRQRQVRRDGDPGLVDTRRRHVAAGRGDRREQAKDLVFSGRFIDAGRRWRWR